MKTVFTYDNYILGDQLLVIVGATKKQILSYARKNYKEESYECVKECIDTICEDFRGGGRLLTLEKDRFRMNILMLQNWENEWKYVDLLTHEIVHYKQHLFEDANISGAEHEFEAYFVQNAVKQIREKLNKKLK